MAIRNDFRDDEALTSFVKSVAIEQLSRAKRIEKAVPGEGRAPSGNSEDLRRSGNSKLTLAHQYETTLKRQLNADRMFQAGESEMLRMELAGLQFALLTLAYQYRDRPGYDDRWGAKPGGVARQMRESRSR
ncbi:hypothetical protein H5399_05130 [Tessaracoccus sp. MC1627]|uniref:hypothetical protein n=1 Tax=Tessaracoccus sp. MC1627 TaxID=2760312 RepID=UPI001602DAE6|nr:hypothetical protein [Tessaracoccus sp. MC1627]MBB1511987.1 hypothetical protein [Tessaracoccus sp. MC1627]